MAENYAKELVQRTAHLEAERGNWENVWQEIADNLIPRRNNIIARRSPGEKRNSKRYSSAGQHALEILAAALHGTLTSKAVLWFELTTGDDELDKQRPIRDWLDECAMRMWRQLNRSNFHSQIHEGFLDLGAFGTALLLEEEAPGDPFNLNFKSFPIESYVAEENDQGMVDAVGIKHAFTARQAIQHYGEKNLDRRILKAAEQQPARLWPFVQWIMPRAERDARKSDAKNMPFASVHVDREHCVIVKEAGYREQAFVCPRWSKAAGEKYGRGPGDEALPDIKVLNEATRLELNGWAKAIDPPLLLEDDGVIGKIAMRPGQPTIVRDIERSLRPFESKARWDVNRIKLEDYRTSIRQAFFADQLELPKAGPEMTATEILARVELMERVLGPTLGRIEAELLNPIIGRTFNLMLRARRLPEPPSEISLIDVRYVGPLARAQKQQEMAAFDRFLQRTAGLAQFDPQVVDLLDADEAGRWLHENHNLPGRLLRGPRAINQLRQQRAQAQQAAQSAALAEQAGKTAKDLAAAAQTQETA